MTNLPSVSILLLGLASYFMPPAQRRALRPFTLHEVLEWSPDLRDIQAARSTCALLAKTGLLSHVWAGPGHAVLNRNPTNPPKWELTCAGFEAMRAARLEANTQYRSQTLAERNKVRKFPDSLPSRLWALFRARRVITCSEAADVLGDAGDDMLKLRKRIGKYLTDWHKFDPDHVQRAKRRVAGSFRYVLDGNVGRFPPAAPAPKSEAKA
ncbi:hypothetical protein G7047_19355 [Diaphorobacter sp. HDW4A]|uniref:hypothetical protein n=1 Tax=Diaphorobacter sp. HDW4A TaxID=2714924 RepID=UPI0014083B20|nr:hypothetical protein [Diaphorobacter sp. HDW4A]QIL81833.1 hypothetical protein G7047_19355 [Diaphorobacter sp. HDW4A]